MSHTLSRPVEDAARTGPGAGTGPCAGLLHHRLANGVDVVGVPMPAPSICFTVNLKRGSMHEPADRNGVTHLVEHLLFHGTGLRTRQQIQDAIAVLGAEVNALTSWTGMCCYGRVLWQRWEPCLRLIADVMTRPLFTPEALDTERAVIRQEMARAAANPRHQAVYELMAERYPGHPLARPIIGTVDMLAAMSAPDVQRYFAGILRPERLTLVVAGRFGWDEVCAVAAEEFGALSASQAEAPVPPLPEAPAGELTVRENHSLPNVHLAYAFGAAAYRDEDYFASQVLATLLGDEKRTSSRLMRNVQLCGLAHDVVTSYHGFDDHGILYTYAATTPDLAARTHRAVVDEFGRLSDVTGDEVGRACRKLVTRIALDAESTQKRSLAVARQFTGSGRLEDLDALCARFRAVAVEDVRRLVDRYRPAHTWTGVAIGPIHNI